MDSCWRTLVYREDDRDEAAAPDELAALLEDAPVRDASRMEFIPVGRDEDGQLVYVHAPDATLPPPGPLLGTDSLMLHAAYPPAAGDLHVAPLPAGTFVFTCNCVQHNVASVCVIAPMGLFSALLVRERQDALANVQTRGRKPNNEQRKRCYQEIAGDVPPSLVPRHHVHCASACPCGARRAPHALVFRRPPCALPLAPPAPSMVRHHQCAHPCAAARPCATHSWSNGALLDNVCS